MCELRDALARPHGDNTAALLDGLAGQRCRDLLSATSLQLLGAFFTPSGIADRIVEGFDVRSWDEQIAFDPACGAGDLLLRVAERLTVGETVSATLEAWNQRLFGCDLSREFVEAARLRILLLAVRRGALLDGPPSELAMLLSNLVVADGLSLSDEYRKSSCIVMNPPYGRVESGTRSWKEGMVTAAALFLDRAAQLSMPGTQIGALLPEVLRTGTNYRHWRNHIDGFVDHTNPQSIGQFSAHADVHVFIQHFTRRGEECAGPRAARVSKKKQTVGTHFTVAVGSVVPHRDAISGPRLAFLHPKNAPLWGEVKKIRETRQFDGRSFAPPFVVVRRTSRPGDRHRASATLVSGARRVAVENHLLVLTPRDGGIEMCRSLMGILRDNRTDTFLDEIMRCRHLTTSSVASVPWT